MTPLETILAKYRSSSMTEREKGTYFEELIRTYFRNEPRFADLYSDVWLFADCGKLIMACGTGKTFTSKIAEEVAGKNKRVLFLVPSLNLLSYTRTANIFLTYEKPF